jgi:hypothetical protein
MGTFSRFVVPDTVRIDISGGDWIVVKKQLTAGEERDVFARLVKPLSTHVNGGAPTFDPRLELDSLQTGLSQVLAYLLDWSLTDADGKPVIIRGQPIAAVTSFLNALDLDSFAEIVAVVQRHDADVKAAAARRRALPFGADASSTTLPSVG